MFKTLKTFLAVAVSFSIVTISSAFADGHMAAIKKWSNGEFSLSTLSAKEREKELESVSYTHLTLPTICSV